MSASSRYEEAEDKNDNEERPATKSHHFDLPHVDSRREENELSVRKDELAFE